MKRKIKDNWFVFFVLILATTITSCSLYLSKEGYLKSFSDFIKEVKEKSDTFTNEDWQKADLQYAKFAKEDYTKYRNELTEAEKEVVGKLKASYQILQLKRDGKNLIEDVKDAIYQIKGAVEEQGDTISNDIN